MKYRAISYFEDLRDGNRAYNAGDIYPREGMTVSAERLAELAGSENLRGEPVIAVIRKRGGRNAD